MELETALAQPLNFKIGLNVEDVVKYGLMILSNKCCIVTFAIVMLFRTLTQLRSLGLPGHGDGLILEDAVDCEPVTFCLQPLLAVEVLLNPSSDTQTFVNQVLMVQRIKVKSLYSNYLVYSVYVLLFKTFF